MGNFTSSFTARGCARKLSFFATILERKYGFDDFNDWFFAGGSRLLGRSLWKGGDQTLIDGIAVNGSARLVGWIASVVRLFQTGHIYTYAFLMIFGIAVFLLPFLFQGLGSK